MKRIAQSVLLAGLTALALAACKTGIMQGDAARTSSTAETESGRTPDYTGSSSASSATGASGAAGTTSSGAADEAAQAGPSNSTVANIEMIPRQGADAATGAGTVAGAAVGGTTGSAAATDRVYRITLQMDDGTVRTVTQESAPSFSTGDRVRLAGGAIVR